MGKYFENCVRDFLIFFYSLVMFFDFCRNYFSDFLFFCDFFYSKRKKVYEIFSSTYLRVFSKAKARGEF